MQAQNLGKVAMAVSSVGVLETARIMVGSVGSLGGHGELWVAGNADSSLQLQASYAALKPLMTNCTPPRTQPKRAISPKSEACPDEENTERQGGGPAGRHRFDTHQLAGGRVAEPSNQPTHKCNE